MSNKISLLINTLDHKKQQVIFEDIQNCVKLHHWIWYGFPSRKENFGCQVSENTKKYGLTLTEAKVFLLKDVLLEYYVTALILMRQYHKTKKNLKIYFSKIDYIKFKSHINLFYEAINELDFEKDKVLQKVRDILVYFYTILNF